MALPHTNPNLTLSRVDAVAAPRFPRRFGARVFAYIAALAIGTSAASVGTFYLRQLGILEHDQARRGATLLAALATQAQLGAYAGDATLLVAAARNTFADDDVVVAAVYDAERREVVRFGHADPAVPAPSPEVLARALASPEAETLRFRVRPPVGDPYDDLYAPVVTVRQEDGTPRRRVVGVARVALSLRPARRQLAEMLRWGLLLGAGILAVGIVAAYLISRRVSRPIGALIHGADRLRSGDLDARVRISSRDEIGQLAYAFNRMARRLNESITALETQSRDLEAEVERRTVEIQRAANFSSLLNAPLGQPLGPAPAPPPVSPPARGATDAQAREPSGPVRGSGPQPIVGGDAEGTLARLLDGALAALIAGSGARAAAALVTTRSAHAEPGAAPPDGELALARYRGAPPDEFGLAPPVEFLREGGPFLYGPRTIVPLLLGAQVEGCLVFVELEARDEVLRFVAHSASQLAIAVSNVRAYAAADELARALRERNLALARQRDQLREMNRLKSEFLANISHELRTPLNAIIGYCELITDGIYGRVTEAQVRALAGIDESGRSLLELINQILDLAKVEAGKMNVHLEEVEVLEVARAVVAEAEPLAKDRPYKVRLEAPEPIGRLRTDGVKVKQILTNLVSNAVKFTLAGEVVVTVRPASGGGCTIAVRDTGIGIKPDDMKIIFEEFRQVDGSYTREFGGTGLGLSIARRFAEMLGGAIAVESEPGAGSTFTLHLPAQPPPPLSARRTQPAMAAFAEGAR